LEEFSDPTKCDKSAFFIYCRVFLLNGEAEAEETMAKRKSMSEPAGLQQLIYIFSDFRREKD
jgi:hypothetical protein